MKRLDIIGAFATFTISVPGEIIKLLESFPLSLQWEDGTCLALSSALRSASEPLSVTDP